MLNISNLYYHNHQNQIIQKKFMDYQISNVIILECQLFAYEKTQHSTCRINNKKNDRSRHIKILKVDIGTWKMWIHRDLEWTHHIFLCPIPYWPRRTKEYCYWKSWQIVEFNWNLVESTRLICFEYLEISEMIHNEHECYKIFRQAWRNVVWYNWTWNENSINVKPINFNGY